jgi:hypothetical protein
MTAQSKKTEQKRLHSCVLPQPKWAKKHEKLESRACKTVKIDELNANAAVRVANALEKAQAQCKTLLLGKYQLMLLAALI